MLAQRRRRWASNSPASGQRLVCDRLHDGWAERTETKVIGRTDERCEVKQYMSPPL